MKYCVHVYYVLMCVSLPMPTAIMYYTYDKLCVNIRGYKYYKIFGFLG